MKYFHFLWSSCRGKGRFYSFLSNAMRRMHHNCFLPVGLVTGISNSSLIELTLVKL